MNGKTSVGENVGDLQQREVGSSRYLPASVQSIVRMGLGIHLLVNGLMMVSSQRDLVESIRWQRHIFVTPLCGVSLIVLALCSALESADFAPIPILSEAATVLHMVSASFVLATFTNGIMYWQTQALLYIVVDFVLGARIRFRYMDIGFALVVILPVVWRESMHSAMSEIVGVIGSSLLLLVISHAVNREVLSEKGNSTVLEPMTTTYEAV